MAIMVTLFLGTMLAGILPMITNELKMDMKNRDAIEARFVAEAGCKRAVAEFYQTTQDWSWVDNPATRPTNWRNFIDSANKQYHTSIELAGSKLVPSSPAAAGSYKITTVGVVGSATKTVTVYVDVPSGGGGGGGSGSLDKTSPFFYALYAGSDLRLNGGGVVNNADIVGKNSITVNGQLDGGRKQISGDAAKGITPLPSFADLTSLRDSSRPVSNYSSSYTAASNENDKTIIVNGDFTVPKNANFSNVTVFATGNINFESDGNDNNLNNCFFVAGKDITAKGGPNFGTSLIVAYGNLEVKGASTLNGGAIIVANDATFNGRGNFNYNASTITKFIGSGGSGGGGTITVTQWK